MSLLKFRQSKSPAKVFRYTIRSRIVWAYVWRHYLELEISTCLMIEGRNCFTVMSQWRTSQDGRVLPHHHPEPGGCVSQQTCEQTRPSFCTALFLPFINTSVVQLASQLLDAALDNNYWEVKRRECVRDRICVCVYFFVINELRLSLFSFAMTWCDSWKQ